MTMRHTGTRRLIIAAAIAWASVIVAAFLWARADYHAAVGAWEQYDDWREIERMTRDLRLMSGLFYAAAIVPALAIIGAVAVRWIRRGYDMDRAQ